MTTRRAAPGAPFRQERYSSSPEFDSGLIGNLVAKRCSVLSDSAEREVIYFLQARSHQPGGLAGLATELVDLFPENFATRTQFDLQKSGVTTFEAHQVKRVRAEIKTPGASDSFLLQGECSFEDSLEDATPRQLAERSKLPCTYPASSFTKACKAAAAQLDECLKKLCLDPAVPPSAFSVWFFQDVIGCLKAYMRRASEAAAAACVTTEIGSLIRDSLSFTLESGQPSLIDGKARTGKTFAVKSWCDERPGLVRYVQIPSCSDDFGFFRAIAQALGVSCNLKAKAHTIRDRVVDMLQHGHLMLVLDEAHYLWPQYVSKRSAPRHIDWVRTALIDQGVPVALVTTPQFLKKQTFVEDSTGWASEQLTGRISHYRALPSRLSPADLERVARFWLPEGSDAAIRALVNYAQTSDRYLAAIDAIVSFARFLSKKRGAAKVESADISEAIVGSVIPSDRALGKAMAEAEGAAPRPGRRIRAFETINPPDEPVGLAASREALAQSQAFARNTDVLTGCEPLTSGSN